MTEHGVEIGKFVGLGFAEDVEVIVIFGGNLGMEGVDFVRWEFVGRRGTEGGVGIGIGGFDVKDAGIDFVDPGEHSERGSVHEANRGRALWRW